MKLGIMFGSRMFTPRFNIGAPYVASGHVAFFRHSKCGASSALMRI